MIDELSGLRLDWALSRDGEGWRVSRIYDDVDAGEVTTNSILADRFERILENTQAEGDTIQIPKYDRLLG